MNTISTAILPSQDSTHAPKPDCRPKRAARRNRVEAGIIIGAFGLALAFMSTQQQTLAPNFTWSPVQTIPVDQSLQLGAWTPLGVAADLSDEAIYRFCVTAEGTGTMVLNPAALIDTVALAGGTPTTTCADTHGIQATGGVLPSATVADPSSNVKILSASWERLEIEGQ